MFYAVIQGLRILPFRMPPGGRLKATTERERKKAWRTPQEVMWASLDSSKHHFHSSSIAQKSVIWPHLTVEEAKD